MDSGLITRTGIINHFYDNISEFVIDHVNANVIVLNNSSKNLQIQNDVLKDEISFFMNISSRFTYSTYSDYGSPVPFDRTQNITNRCKVMLAENGKFNMVSAEDNDEWLTCRKDVIQDPNGKYREGEYRLDTVLNKSFKVLPDSEELHFQRCTVDDYVCEYEECIKIHEMIRHIKSFGTVVSVNPKLKATFIFK